MKVTLFARLQKEYSMGTNGVIDSKLYKKLQSANKTLVEIDNTVKMLGDDYDADIACEIRPKRQHCKYIIKRSLKDHKKAGGDLTEFLFCDLIFVREIARRMIDETNISKGS